MACALIQLNETTLPNAEQESAEHEMNKQTRMILKNSATCIATTTMLVSIGCETCSEKAEGMQNTYDRTFQQMWQCCSQMTEPQKTQCFANLNQQTGEVGGIILQWQTACETGREDLMATGAGALRDILKAGCIGILLADSGTTNVTSPLIDIPNLTLDINTVDAPGSHGPIGASMLAESMTSVSTSSTLRGQICVSIGDAFLCGSAKGRLSYQNTPSQDSSVRSYKPTQFKLNLAIPGAKTTLHLIPNEGNQLTIGRDGTGFLKVAMAFNTPIDSGIIQDEIWLEFPVTRTLGGISIKSDGMTGLELAPEAPPAFADWNGDLVVDDMDYAQFVTDFADHRTDLNLDGSVDHRDFMIFSEIWESAL